VRHHRRGRAAERQFAAMQHFASEMGHFRTNAVRRTLLQREPGSLTTFAAIRSLPERMLGRAP
jgi:hypothetical protein